MKNITIKNRCYHPITTCIDGVTFMIPPKGKERTIQVSEVSDHLKELVADKKIVVIINEEIHKEV